MPIVALARHAMATRFELVLHGPDEVALRAAGEEALREIERQEAQLSLFLPTSQIARINARAAHQPVRVTPELFALLEHSRRLSQMTEGAFDITIGPLVRCWGFVRNQGKLPDPQEIKQAMARVGMDLIQLSPEDCSIRFKHGGMMIDLGAIGKGYAIEQALQILRETGVQNALLHGGTSTISAIGTQADGQPWKIAVESPATAPELPPTLLATVCLHNQALSVSAVWGKAFEVQGKTYGHVLDPRAGQPTNNATLAAVVTDSATDADALSTALLVRGTDGLTAFRDLFPSLKGLVLGPPEPGVHAAGIELWGGRVAQR